MSEDLDSIDVLPLVSSIMAAYLSSTKLAPNELPGLVRALRDTLTSLARGDAPRPAPAVPIAQSVTSRRLVCLEDGLQFQSLKKHLGEVHGMSPEKYRARWGLRADYPMVAADYSKLRSKLAKKSRLGTHPMRSQPARARRPSTKLSAKGQSRSKGRRSKS